MPTPTQTDLYITYARKFIGDFARPSVIIELIDTLDCIDDEPEPLASRIRQMLVTELSYHNRELAEKYKEPSS